MNEAHHNDAIEMLATSGVRHSKPGVRVRGHKNTRANDQGVVFIFDAHGRTRFCSDPSAFVAKGGDVVNTPISLLLPDLPLRENTPGYNIAYVRLAFCDGQWQQHAIRTADDRLQPAEICLKPIPLDRNFCLVGLVRLQHADEMRHPSAAVHTGLPNMASLASIIGGDRGDRSNWQRQVA